VTARGSLRRRALLLLGGGLVLALGWYGWRWYTAPVPPDVPLENAEPAVARAIQDARREVLDQPRSAAAWGRLGMVLHAHLFIHQALACYARAEEYAPRDPRWPYLQGVLRMRTKPDLAIRHLRRAADLSGSEEVAAWLRLAEGWLELHRLDEAEAAFREVLRRQPDNLPAHLGLGKVAYGRGDFQASVPFLQRAATGPETRTVANRLLATVCTRLGARPEAARAAALAQDLPADVPWRDPFREEVNRLAVGMSHRLHYAERLRDRGRLREATRVFQELVRDYPEDSWCLTGLGQTLYQQGDLTGAERALRAAVVRTPDMVVPRSQLGLLLWEQARALLRRPSDREVGLKRLREAVQCFREVTRVKPDYADGYARLGDCLGAEGKEDEAIAAYRSALRCQPRSPQVHVALAELLVRQGRDGEALLQLDRALGSAADSRPLRLLAQVLGRSAGWR
jgi:tetratricopeptide (TPR) repeat protein